MTKFLKLNSYQIKNQIYNRLGKHFYFMFKLKPKVFGIGLNRTGSTSLGIYFQKLGYKHCFEWFSSQQLKKMLTDDSYLKRKMNPFEMHEDWPTALVYDKLTEWYPDAKFILTLRETPEQWFASLKNTSRQEESPHNKTKELIYGYGVITDEHKYELIERYKKHVEDVKAFFKETDKLLILKTSDKDKEDKICNFLGITNPGVHFPHGQKRQYI